MTHSKIQHYGPVVGRSLLALLFIVTGLGILTNIPATAGYYTTLGIPAAALVAIVVLLIKLGAGGMLVAGVHAREAAWVLIVFVIGTILIAHTGQGQLIPFLKNLAIIGGLLLIAVHGAGPISWEKKCPCPVCKAKRGESSSAGGNNNRSPAGAPGNAGQNTATPQQQGNGGKHGG